MDKQRAKEKLAELEQKAAELRAIIDEPEVKPLFPKSREEGARFYATDNGHADTMAHWDAEMILEVAKQGRTFYTSEEAEKFAKRERARAYCLERINEVNEGNNGFKAGNSYELAWYHRQVELDCIHAASAQTPEALEYIRTKQAAEQLINDPEFVEQWKTWKLGENL